MRRRARARRRKKSSSASLPGPTIAGRPVTVNGAEVLDDGHGQQDRVRRRGRQQAEQSLDGQVTVTVAQRLPNGNLLVRGQKWIAINQGKEYVRIQGIVRPIDIDPDNSISSLKVADAMISYGAKGALADANTPGPAGTLLQFLLDAVLRPPGYGRSMNQRVQDSISQHHGRHVGADHWSVAALRPEVPSHSSWRARGILAAIGCSPIAW